MLYIALYIDVYMFNLVLYVLYICYMFLHVFDKKEAVTNTLKHAFMFPFFPFANITVNKC